MAQQSSGGLNPAWLFVTIVTILLGHYVYLGTVLTVCYGVISKEADIYLRQKEAQGVNPSIRKDDLEKGQQLCADMDDQFRNARNKALEIILALLVPSGAVGAVYAAQPKKPPPPPPNPPPKV
jgi:hypothetical protein